MRSLIPLSVLVAALACAPGAALADDMDAWCAQVKKASSIVICSDAQLREQAIARNKLFEAARAKLSPETLKALTDDQSRWIKSYTARCGVAMDDPPPAMPVPQSVIDCYRRASLARSAYLAARLSVPNPAGAAPNPYNQFDDAGNPRAAPAPATAFSDVEKDAIDALVHAGKPRAQVEAQVAWEDCTETAVDHFADQQEPARSIAEAAIALCGAEEIRYAQETIKDPIFQQIGTTLFDMMRSYESGEIPRLMARVMAVRAAHAKLRKESPETKPAIDYGRM